MAIVNGTPGNDVLIGTAEDDTIDGLDGDDSISGGDGFDTIYDGPGDDIVFGESGNDTIYASAGNDAYDGGIERNGDSMRYDFATAGIIVDLRLSTGQVRSVGEADAAGIGVDTLSNFETIFGSNFDDFMYAVDGYYEKAGLHGGGGNDTLVGSPGFDSLLGGDGDDVLTGGAAPDTLSGGLGDDTFIDTSAGLDNDDIRDFDYGDGIVILDADPSTFQWSLGPNDRIYFSGDSFFMDVRPGGHLVVTAAEGGGVQFTLEKNDPENDFNGDGLSDVLWRRDDGAFTAWLGQPDGGFVSNDTNAWELVPTSWRVDGTGDFDGDGRDDVIWRNDNGTFTTWLGQTDGGFVFNDANSWTVLPTSWQVVGAGDFNGDGRDDILWRHSDGWLTNWLAQANGAFVSNDANAWSAPLTYYHVAATGDFNGDNRDDLILRGDDGTFTERLGQASGGFTINYPANTEVPTNWHIQPEPNLLF